MRTFSQAPTHVAIWNDTDWEDGFGILTDQNSMTNRSTAVAQSVHQHDGTQRMDTQTASLSTSLPAPSAIFHRTSCHSLHSYTRRSSAHGTLPQNCSMLSSCRHTSYFFQHPYSMRNPRHRARSVPFCPLLIAHLPHLQLRAKLSKTFFLILLTKIFLTSAILTSFKSMHPPCTHMTLQASNTTPRSFNSARLACF